MEHRKRKAKNLEPFDCVDVGKLSEERLPTPYPKTSTHESQLEPSPHQDSPNSREQKLYGAAPLVGTQQLGGCEYDCHFKRPLLTTDSSAQKSPPTPEAASEKGKGEDTSRTRPMANRENCRRPPH